MGFIVDQGETLQAFTWDPVTGYIYITGTSFNLYASAIDYSQTFGLVRTFWDGDAPSYDYPLTCTFDACTLDIFCATEGTLGDGTPALYSQAYLTNSGQDGIFQLAIGPVKGGVNNQVGIVNLRAVAAS